MAAACPPVVPVVPVVPVALVALVALVPLVALALPLPETPALEAAGGTWEPEAGKETALAWPGLGEPLMVRLPDAWDPARKWPLLFYYPGTGGRPTVALPVDHGAGGAFIIAGMAYTVKGPVPAGDSEQFYRDTVRILEEVRDHLAAVAGADATRVYVGGFSKGGWTAAHFADKHPLHLAGAIIMGAGANPFREGEELPRFREGTPVYVGVGQLELNYAASLQAAEHYGSRGATVTIDVHDGLGHQPASDPRSEYLEQWLAIEAHRDAPRELKPVFEAWHAALEARLASAAADPLLACLILERAGNAPFARFFRRTEKAAFSQRLSALKQHATVAREWETRHHYESIRKREAGGGFRLANWEAVILDYAAIYRNRPDSLYGKRAGLDALRLLESIREAVRQRAASGKPTGDFLERNARMVAELAALPASELRRSFADLRRALAVPVIQKPE